MTAMTYAEHPDGNTRPEGTEEIHNSTDCSFGPGTLVFLETDGSKWFVAVKDTREPDVDAPIPDADSV